MDHGCLFFLNDGLQCFCNFAVTCTCFGHDKVEKDDVRNDDGDKPDEPEHPVFVFGELCGCVDAVEIANTQP